MTDTLLRLFSGMPTMPRDTFLDDIDSTAELPALGIRILSNTLQRAEFDNIDTSLSANNESIATHSTSDWRMADNLAALQDKVATLKATLIEEQNRYARLEARHNSLLNAMTDMETQLQNHIDECVRLREAAVLDAQQRRQRDVFIVKQARELKRLREKTT